MKTCKHTSILIGCLSVLLGSLWVHGENPKHPFITTQSPLTLFSTQDAELTVFRRGGPRSCLRVMNSALRIPSR